MSQVNNSDSVPENSDTSPTSNALARFRESIQEPQANATPRPIDQVTRWVDVPGKGPEPTSAAEVKFYYREARGRFRVPDR